jgi:hypothetical protein
MGVVHGAASYIIQSKTGQLIPTHSISAGKMTLSFRIRAEADIQVLITTRSVPNILT